jgi:hypothetical protein
MNVAEQTLAYITHTAPGRCRFKIPCKRRDAAYFQTLREALLDTSGVEQVQTNPLTASVLILYDAEQVDINDLTAQLQTANQFELSDRPIDNQTVWEKALSGFESLDNQLKQSTSGQFDSKSLLLVVLIIMAIRQMQQGVVFAPAITLILHALQMLIRNQKQ